MKDDDRSLDPATIAGQIAALSPEKRKLLRQKLQNRMIGGSGHRAIPLREGAASAPLSFAQQRLWFFDQLEPGSSAYNMPCAFRLRGRLDTAALEQSVNEIILRHEVLRTRFVSTEGEPVQTIAPRFTLTFDVVDLREVAEAEREDAALRLAAEEAHRPFDLAAAPPVRGKLLRLDEADYIVLLTLHHIVSDGWSMSILLRELAEIYDAFATGKPSPLEELPIQYADFAVWQREWLRGKVLEEQLSYWKNQLDRLPTVEFPTDYVRSPAQTFTGARESLTLSRALTRRLRALSQESKATLFMTLLAALDILLQRYTGHDDIVVGSPIAGRTREETEGLIGFFINNLVLRVDLSGNPTFSELLERVKKTALDAYAHQDLPFEKLVEELQPKRDLSRTPLFQIFLNLLELEVPDLRLHGLTVEQLAPRAPESKFDFTCYVRERNQELRFDLVYNTSLFRQETAQQLLLHFRTLLEAVVAAPDRRLSDLDIFTAEERHRLLVEWNGPRAAYPAHLSIHQLFEARAERSPDSVALRFDGEKLTYAELNERANRLARYLRRRGVGPETLAGICIERSPEMVIAMLGILKAGGAYIPLDPSYPSERLAFMMEDSHVAVVLTQSKLLSRLPKTTDDRRPTTDEEQRTTDDRRPTKNDDVPFSLPDRSPVSGPPSSSQSAIPIPTVICLDTDRQTIAAEAPENLTVQTTPDNLAYVIYTSGSTGKPKGVLSRHGGAVNYFTYLIETYRLTSADTVLQIPSMSFDASVRDILGSLIAGAALVLVNDAPAKGPEALLAKMTEHGVTCLLSVGPTMLAGMIEIAGGRESPKSSVRLILVSGDVLHVSVCRKAQELFGPQANIINQYGPTETTMTATYHRVDASPNGGATALIGKPIPNVQVCILDRGLDLAPVGVAGELHIGGAGLARGYHDRPELTAEKFIPHPFAAETGARLYKTGDSARWLPDGAIEFLGRIDNQVKIRDFRVELGEVEEALLRHPAVRRAVAVVREEPASGSKELVAYIVAEPEQEPTIGELLRFIKSKLPDYMAPSAFVLLGELPLTPNGKVDRKALPAPDRARPALAETFVAPRYPIEQELAEIWAIVLGLNRIGVRDDFFELGGHSLLATKVVSRIRRVFSIDLPLRLLFDSPTVEQLAAQIKRLKTHDEPDEMEQVLAELESLSDEEAERLAAAKGA